MAQSHKSPYEIRENLLELAFNILREQHSAKSVAAGKNLVDSAPTTEEIIKEAQRLNEFVSARGERQ